MGLFSKAWVAIFFAMGAVVLYRAVLSVSRVGGLLSLRLDSRIDPERILAVAVALGSASIYGVARLRQSRRSPRFLFRARGELTWERIFHSGGGSVVTKPRPRAKMRRR